MTVEEAVAAIDALSGRDPEVDHINADNIVFEFVPKEIEEAYERLMDRADWWAYA